MHGARHQCVGLALEVHVQHVGRRYHHRRADQREQHGAHPGLNGREPQPAPSGENHQRGDSRLGQFQVI